MFELKICPFLIQKKWKRWEKWENCGKSGKSGESENDLFVFGGWCGFVDLGVVRLGNGHGWKMYCADYFDQGMVLGLMSGLLLRRECGVDIWSVGCVDYLQGD